MSSKPPRQPDDPNPRRPNPSIPEKKRSKTGTWSRKASDSGRFVSKAAPSGKFVVKKGSTGKFRFSLISRNGQVVLTSEAYTTKGAALAGIQSVKHLAAAALTEDATVAPAPTKTAKTTKTAFSAKTPQ